MVRLIIIVIRVIVMAVMGGRSKGLPGGGVDSELHYGRVPRQTRQYEMNVDLVWWW